MGVVIFRARSGIHGRTKNNGHSFFEWIICPKSRSDPAARRWWRREESINYEKAARLWRCVSFACQVVEKRRIISRFIIRDKSAHGRLLNCFIDLAGAEPSRAAVFDDWFSFRSMRFLSSTHHQEKKRKWWRGRFEPFFFFFFPDVNWFFHQRFLITCPRGGLSI